MLEDPNKTRFTDLTGGGAGGGKTLIMGAGGGGTEALGAARPPQAPSSTQLSSITPKVVNPGNRRGGAVGMLRHFILPARATKVQAPGFLLG